MAGINLKDSGSVLSIRMDERALADIQAMLSPGQYRVAMQMGISETLDFGRKYAGDRIQEEIVIKDRDVKKVMAIKKPSFRELKGVLDVSRRPMPLSLFGPRMSGRGKNKVLTVQVRRKEPREVIRAGFKWGSKVLTRRIIGGGVSKRYPLRQAQGPTAVGVLANAPGLLERTYNAMGGELTKRVLNKVDFVLSGNPNANRLVDRASRIR